MPLDLKSVDLQSSISTATWISSLASSITDNPEIATLSCLLIFVCAIAYQISPPLSPRTQLELMKHNIDSISDLFNTSRDDMDFEHRYEIHTRLNRIQIDACESEIHLLNTEKDGISWREYFRSLKRVYFDTRAYCKDIDAVRIKVMIASTAAKQQRFSHEQAGYSQESMGPNPECFEMTSSRFESPA
ncbi:hypothetical protein ARMGADRAFT_1004725 [Armillaria gallica]|uniref:Fungal N-terminal domain-containing protein n=1 Tax=Armillaria gallica TaxID=47427 RepID=A0A2H3END6_ARMGA|nr:hypothetical protein ARMGADRAFT_1004725 [Armillaria gallica]